jgi:hypothetical protein
VDFGSPLWVGVTAAAACAVIAPFFLPALLLGSKVHLAAELLPPKSDPIETESRRFGLSVTALGRCRAGGTPVRVCGSWWVVGVRTLLLVQIIVHVEPASAQSEAPASSKGPPATQIVVTGTRDPEIAPVLQISPAEVSSYGADSLQELLDALVPRTRSSMSDRRPVVLINGRLAGPTELQNLPPEAILRIDVLPEKVALRYGYPDDRRVVNLILRERFRSLIGQLLDRQPTEGGGQKGDANASGIDIDHETQATVKADYKESEQLLENQRDITATDSDFRALEPATDEAKLAATVTRPFFNLRPSLDAYVDIKSSDALQGLASETASVPAGTDSVADPPSATVGNEPLSHHMGSTESHIAGRITGFLGRLTWTASAAYNHTITHTLGGTGIDSSGAIQIDQTDSSLDRGRVDASLGGAAVALPAGMAMVNINLNSQVQDYRTQAQLSGSAAQTSHLSRTTGNARVGANIPLTSRDADVLPYLGDLSARFHAGVEEVSNFGALTSFGYGMTWVPIKKLSFNAAFSDTQTAPSLQALLDPAVVTPGVQMFDFVTGETDYVTQITGGDDDLRRTDTDVTSFGMFAGPFGSGSTFSAIFERRCVIDAVGPVPPVTAAIEAAFPDRFIRDASGTLVEVDSRSVNLALEEQDDLKWGLNLVTLGNTTPSDAPPGLRLTISIYHVWYFHDTILVRDGLPELDLLDGSPSSVTGTSVAGTQSRHTVDLRAVLGYRGFGAQLMGRWKSATEADSGDPSSPDSLYFSAVTTANLQLFADLGQLPATRAHAWAKGTRVTFGVTNLFDSYQRVRDAAGATPLGFEKGYVDPFGRVISLSVRKVF